jgi:hypothetical protein
VWAAKVRVARGEGGQLDDGDMLGSLAPDLRALVKNVLDATRVYALRCFPERCVEVSDHRYRFKVTKEDEPSSGESAGLPCALAFLSVFLELPIRQDGVHGRDRHRGCPADRRAARRRRAVAARVGARGVPCVARAALTKRLGPSARDVHGVLLDRAAARA